MFSNTAKKFEDILRKAEIANITMDLTKKAVQEWFSDEIYRITDNFDVEIALTFKFTENKNKMCS